MDIKLGFIGIGNMGSAMIRSIAKSPNLPIRGIYIYDIDTEKMNALKNDTGAEILKSGAEVVEKSDVIILAVKPNMVKTVLEESIDKFDDKKILVSIAVGLPIKLYKDIIGNNRKVIRTMPNTLPRWVKE
jgi:pyrroline-5-carboxylate reductase